jgi:hypothetical protein
MASPMRTVSLTDRQITQTLIALQEYQARLADSEGDELADAVGDLHIVQSVIDALEGTRQHPAAPDTGERR